jgi:excinuclease ABC subunit A
VASKEKKRGSARPTTDHRPLTTGASAASDVKAPWEIDGRKWHTQDRVAGNGRPARWDGRILETIVDRIEAAGQGGFAPTEWSQRGVVRVKGGDEARVAFPFFHATTSSEWVVTLRFFVPKGTFRAGAVEKLLALVPFHQVEPPVLSDLPRLRINDLGPFQEIAIVGHGLADFETDGFDVFLKKAAAAFLGLGRRAKIQTASELTG